MGRAIGLLVAATGVASALAAFACDAAWFQRHIALPCFYPAPPPWLHSTIRAGLAAVALLLLAAARPLGRRTTGAGTARVSLAVLLALGAAEWMLRHFDWTAPALRSKRLEYRLGREDARYGWALLPSKTTLLGASRVRYAVDAWGDRAASDRAAPDPARPSLIVAGESIAFGYGLEYEQTFAAVLGRELDLQVVNVGVGGYGTDQAALRLEDALHKLERPVAIVQVFVSAQLQRNVRDYRPHLALRDGALALVPRASGLFAGLRMRDMVVNETPVLFEWQLRESLAVTRAMVLDVGARVRARGAALAFLVVSFGARSDEEERLVQAVFAGAEVPFVEVQVDTAHLLPYDGHPDAVASRALAAAAASALRGQMAPGRAAAALPQTGNGQ
jgi:hypothetical protein